MEKFAIVMGLIAAVQLCVGQDFSSLGELSTITAALDAKNTLDFGANCNHTNERLREAAGKSLLQAMTSSDMSGLPAALSKLRNLSQMSGNFCNSLKNLQCQSNWKCGCANAEIGGIQMRSVREGNFCRLDRGSACVPPESLSSLGARTPDLRCKQNTSCQLKSDRSVCTQTRMTQEMMSSFTGNMRDMNAFRTHIMNKMREGICQCN